MIKPLSLLFSNPQGEDAKGWYSQGLASSPNENDILLQKKGGPCGVLAALQAHICLRMVFLGFTDPLEALVDSISEVLERAWKAPSGDTPVPIEGIAVCSRKGPNDAKGWIFDPNEELVVHWFTDVEKAKAELRTLVKSQYASESGIMLFVLSIILSRQPGRVRDDMDDPEALMTGQFGHCGQEMLNLIIAGQAASQVHDGVVEVADSGLLLRGVSTRPRVGLLTQLEALRYCQVGSFLKNPEFPVWVIGSESHFTVLYATDKNCDAKSMEQETFEKGKRAFTSRDRQENGFVKSIDIEGILKDLGLAPETERDLRVLQSLVKKCEMVGSEGIVIWTSFWPVIGPILREGKGLKDLPDTAWSCSACTFLNEDVEARVCVVCGQAKPAPAVQQQETRQGAQRSSPWTCTFCTLRNAATDEMCQACSASRSSQLALADTMKETEAGGRTFELVHMDGLQKTIGGQVIPPKKTRFKLTTVDATLAGPGTSGFGSPFEEVLQTKWAGAVFDYGPGGSPPSIVG